MRKISIFLIFISVAAIAAQPMSQQQKQEVIAKINTAATGLKTMSCSFVQTKHLSLLSDKMVSKGNMYYKQPDKLRWEYTSPYQYLFVLNGTKVYVGNKSRKDVIDTNTNKVFKEVARIMMSTVTGKALSNASDFSIDVSADNNVWRVTMIPKKKDLKQMFAKVILDFSKNNLMISEINIFEKKGDKTNIKLNNVSYNKAVNETLFVIP